jgi:hypothetical protein
MIIDENNDTAYLQTDWMYSSLLIGYWLMIRSVGGTHLFWNQTVPLRKVIPPNEYSLIVSFGRSDSDHIAIKSNAPEYLVWDQVDQISEIMYGCAGVFKLVTNIPFLDVDSHHQIVFPCGQLDRSNNLFNLEYTIRLTDCIYHIDWVILERFTME